MARGKKKTPKTKGRKAKTPAAEPDEPAAAEAAEAETAAEAPTEAPTEAPEAPEVTVVQLEAEMASLKDQLLRALAETENLRRRSQREREDIARYAAAPLLRDLLGVADNLRRALESVPPEAAEDSEQLKTLLDGVELTEKELHSVFARHHVVKIDPLGERLDPHSHEAMFEVPDPASPAGTIVQVVQSGYRLFDRLLRAAQVGVAKGGPAPEPKAPPGEAAEDDAEAPEPEETPAAGGETPSAEDGEDDLPPGSRVDTTA
ncbi:MAG: nucleotide exchange factor GrpE [Kiloniellales bacterium]